MWRIPHMDYLCMPGGYILVRELRRIPIPGTSVNKGKKEGRVRLDWSDAAGSGLWLLEDYEQEEDEEILTGEVNSDCYLRIGLED